MTKVTAHAKSLIAFIANEMLEICVRFRRIRKIAKKKRPLASSCLSVRPTARIEQLRSHSTDFHES
jgi:hypothetical protein